MDFQEFATLIEKIEDGRLLFITEGQAHLILDVARQRRWPLSIAVEAKLATALAKTAPEGSEYQLLLDGSRVRHMFRLKGQKTSLDGLNDEGE